MKKQINYLLLLVIGSIFSVSCNNEQTNKKEETVAGTEFKTGVALFSFHRHPFTTALAMADSAGIKNVEGFSFYKLGADFNDSTMGNLDKPGIDKMKQMLEQKGIKMTSMYVEAKNAAEWKKYFDLAREFNMQYLVCEPAKEHWNLIDSLAGEYKIKIAIHEHAKEYSAYWHPDSVLAAIKGHANIGACADLGHWARSGLNPVECLKKLEGHVFEIHLKDIDESGNAKAKDVNPGTGVIDFTAVVKELKRQQFNGIIYSECEHNLDNNRKDVEEAIRYINELATKTGN